MGALLLILLVLGIVGGVIYVSQKRQRTQIGATETASLEDFRAEARRWVDRLGGQVLNVQGTDEPSKQAMADASERFNAATSQLETATTPVQARLAQDTAVEGLYYVRAARVTMGMDPGPDIPKTDGQNRAGQVTEDRTVDIEGRQVSASSHPSDQNSNYYPGGMVAGRPVPAGWYSEPWWQSALRSGMWTMGSMMLFNAMFSGMSGIGHEVGALADGIGDGLGDAGGALDGLFGGGGDGGGGGFFDGIFGGGDGDGFFDF